MIDFFNFTESLADKEGSAVPAVPKKEENKAPEPKKEEPQQEEMIVDDPEEPAVEEDEPKEE